MRSLIVALLAVTMLGGCVAVPYAEPVPAGYYYGPAYAPASVYFRYDYYRGGPRYYYRHH